MTVKNPNDSVQDEQFNIDKNGDAENIKNIKNASEEEKSEPSAEEEKPEPLTDEEKPDDSVEVEQVDDKLPVDTTKGTDVAEEKATDKTDTEIPADNHTVSGDDAVEKPVASGSEESSKPEDETGTESDKISEPLEDLPEVDYSGHSRAELVETIEILIENRPPHEIKTDVDKIKTLFYKKHKAEQDALKKKFVKEGGNPEDFSPHVDELEQKLKNLLSRYRGKKTEYSKQLEIEKQINLKRKYEIIDSIKDLVNREESINKTFQEFRELQNEWYSIGLVPQSSLKNLWENYNHNVEIFYDYIKINKELRDLDFKKNLESKIKLCERAEELILIPNPVNAFHKLQELHQRWREIGPVPREVRNDLWNRFKEATSKINKAHHAYFEEIKAEQKNNLEAKRALCEKVEEINSIEINSFSKWDELGKQVIEFQKVWRTIGFAPKKHNNSIYKRFREACDNFFQNKRDFYARNKAIQTDNLHVKTELCLKAESLKDSTDWKETTEALIKLQKKWKEIGPVPRKHSDKIWKRFRAACDYFFEKKTEYYSGLDTSFEENLKSKLAIIEKLENMKPGSDPEETVEKLKELQNEWSQIGFVPFKDKDEIGNRYRSALDKLFESLNIDDKEKSLLKYRNKLENLAEGNKSSRKIRSEREKFINKIKQLEGDIVLWENNIGFFSKSSNAEAMIKEVENKIENAKNNIKILEEKVRMIDQSGLDE